MDRRLVTEKPEALRRCLERVEAKRPARVAELQADVDLQDILAVNLTRAVQVCVDLGAHVVADLDVPAPRTMGDTFDALADAGVIPEALARRMRAAVGFRNVAVHAYQAIDWEIVYAISHERLGDFAAFARAPSGAADLGD